MRPELDHWTVVVVGQWNPRIFTPQWVAKNLFEREKIDVEIAATTGAHVFRLIANDVVFIAQDDRIIAGIRILADESLSWAERVCRKAMQLLSHTPVVAYGINFAFLEPEPRANLLGIFKTGDLGNLADFGCPVRRSQLTRQLETEQGVCNLVLGLQDGILQIRLNYHFPVENAALREQDLNGQAQRCHEFSRKLLRDVYNLTEEAATNGNRSTTS